ncbi:hypothetical protein [Paenimyroides aestuarii]|uniref:Uncharacterized protein n=1 Tax=Paenimyroides aestuarii TaxID=2968490 RepID=A0ABY5NUH6_9FLAO|nr:hypothetical protein [Paenimyroides aestuarii]UUV22246.1 hypothetical protein NPX36_04200 [Paenimyroides aestuarii]
MQIFNNTHRKIILLLLALLIVVPCSVKKDFKISMQIGHSQHHKTENIRIACASFVSLKEQSEAKTTLNRTVPKLPLNSGGAIHRFCTTTVIAFEVYNQQKEKVPSYLLLERFLI